MTTVHDDTPVCNEHGELFRYPDDSLDLRCEECDFWVESPLREHSEEFYCDDCGTLEEAFTFTSTVTGEVRMYGWFCPRCDEGLRTRLDTHSRDLDFEDVGFISATLDDFGNADRVISRFGYRLRFIPGTGRDGGRWLWWDDAAWTVVGEDFVAARVKHVLEGLSMSRFAEWHAHREATKKNNRDARKTFEAQCESVRRQGGDELPSLEIFLTEPANPGWQEFPGLDIGAAIEDADIPLKDVPMTVWGEKQQSSAALRATLQAVRSDSRVQVSEEFLQGQPGLFALRNGVYDTRAMRFLPALPDQRVTRSAGYDYDPEADAPELRRFLGMNFSDPETRRYIQKLAGYSLTGEASHKAFWFFYSAAPDTGKSLLLEVLGAMHGEYSVSLAEDTLSPRRSGDGGRDPDRHALMGARFGAASELRPNQPMDEPFMKRLTSGGLDKVQTRGNYSIGNTEWTPECTVVIATNSLSRIDGGDEAVWSRVVVIPFTESFPKDDPRRDEELGSRIVRNELPGVLNWALEGLRMYREEGLIPSREIAEATAAYQAASDGVGSILTGLIEEGILEMTPVSTEEEARDAVNSDDCAAPTDLYKLVTEYARATRTVFDMTGAAFRERVESEGHPYVQGSKGVNKGKRRLAGVKILTTTEEFRRRTQLF